MRKKRKQDEQTLEELNLAHRRSQAECQYKAVTLRWMVPVFRFFEYVNYERKEQKVNSTP